MALAGWLWRHGARRILRRGLRGLLRGPRPLCPGISHAGATAGCALQAGHQSTLIGANLLQGLGEQALLLVLPARLALEQGDGWQGPAKTVDRKSTRLNSSHT